MRITHKRVVVEWGLLWGGVLGVLLFEAPYSSVAGGLNGVGVCLVFSHSADDFWWAAGITGALCSWGVLGIIVEAWSLVVATLVGALWFAVKTHEHYHNET